MLTLNFRESEPPKKWWRSSPLKKIIGLFTVIGIFALGSTLAASINLNAGTPVEFGQGIAQTIACDNEVKLTPISSFSNAEESGFMFTGITLSDLDGSTYIDSTDLGCADKSFILKLYGENGNLLPMSYSIALDVDGNFASPDGQTNGSNEGASDSSVTLTFAEPTISAESIYRITIESNDGWIAGTPVSFSTSCDDQITVTPYSRSAGGYQALNRVDISNLDLTPQGYNFALDGFATKEEALAVHPGEYWDIATSAWKETCDRQPVVLRAFTASQSHANLALENDINNQLWMNYTSDPSAENASFAAYNTAWGFKMTTNPTLILKLLGGWSQWEGLTITDISVANKSSSSLSLRVLHAIGWGPTNGIPISAIDHFTLESPPDMNGFAKTCLRNNGNGECGPEHNALG